MGNFGKFGLLCNQVVSSPRRRGSNELSTSCWIPAFAGMTPPNSKIYIFKLKENTRNVIKKLLFFSFLSYSTVHADISRQDITALKKQREVLTLEQKRLLSEADAIGKMIMDLDLLSEEEKKMLTTYQIQIFKTLPLLARLERSNPIRMVIDPTISQEKVRGIILTRFLISSIKRKMQQVQANLNDIKIKTHDLVLKNQSTQALIQDIENKKAQLNLTEHQKVKDWIKEESARLAKEEDPNVLLEESRTTLSKNARSVAAATALTGLPFRKLMQPVVGKIFKDTPLQNRFSPHAQGIFFETPKNALVCAPARGKIVFRGPFRNHAEILIIDHGEKAHTILMGMDKINADVGKIVYTGEKLGVMAGYGYGSPHLYLELRYKGQAIDPTPYFLTKNLE